MNVTFLNKNSSFDSQNDTKITGSQYILKYKNSKATSPMGESLISQPYFGVQIRQKQVNMIDQSIELQKYNQMDINQKY